MPWMLCDKDCFNCKLPDCINDDMDQDDRRESRERDLLTLTREKATQRLKRQAYVESHREAINRSAREYRARHRDKINAQRRARYGCRQQAAVAYQRNYYREHRDEILIKAAARYAARKETVHEEMEA